LTKIAIGGDVCMAGINQQFFADGDAEQLYGSLADRLRSSDLTMVNLESPLYAEPNGIRKSGPILGVPDACVAGLVAGGIDLVGLANNHAMDHSVAGLQNTIDVCKKRGIATVGAGVNLAEARTIYVRWIDGIRIGVLACAEREFGLAGRAKWGVNPLDPIDFVRNVREHSTEFDYLIVLIHGGNEHFRYPRPSLVQICRFFVEEGADIVLCQHSHCVGCVEMYKDGYIVYGQGNFIFDSPEAPDSWREGGLIFISLDQDLRSSIEFVPIVQKSGVPGAWSLEGTERQATLDAIVKRSHALQDSNALERLWSDYCAAHKSQYLRQLGSRSRFARGVDRLTGYIQYGYALSWASRANHLNLVRCESHREALIHILSKGLD
jgi:poly-gamma-glutamate capsule biosynthesis protein CapA/YwtB (metallophosphatase superfamily)